MLLSFEDLSALNGVRLGIFDDEVLVMLRWEVLGQQLVVLKYAKECWLSTILYSTYRRSHNCG